MKKIIALSVLTLVNSAAHADVRINGFANLIGGITSSDETLYGYDDQIAFSEESLFAIQFSADINNKMTATGQIVARGENDYRADFEWAYITYATTDNVDISAGRFRAPIFRYSSSKDVGYSYHWITAPRAVYDVVFNNIDGIRVDYNNYAGDWEINLQGLFGTYSSDLPGGTGTVDGKNVYAFTAEATYESFKFRTVYGVGKTTVTVASIDAALENLHSAGLNNLADDLALVNDSATFMGFGAEYDNFDYFLSAEITQSETKQSFSPTDTSYYITAGIRLDKFTPSITYEKRDGNQHIKFLDQVATLPAELQPLANGTIVALQQPFMEEFSSLILGIRYDLDTNVALKADISKYSDDMNDANDATLVRFAVNYVF